MGGDFPQAIYLFAIFSLSGWGLEFVFRSARAGKMVNPGLLRGPYLPIYGAGALLLYLASQLLNGRGLAVKVPLYFFITTGLELLTGYFSAKYLHLRLWDYSGESFNLGGHICLKYSAYWVFLALAAEYLFFPPALSLYRLSPLAGSAATGLALVMVVDGLWRFSSLLVAKKQGIPAGKREMGEFAEALKPLLQQGEVAGLSRFQHHHKMTRMDHCLEVAWISFLWAKRLSCDGRAAARGALLHDLFYYEWLTEGPRLHGFRHPRLCLENARRITELSEIEEDIILKHMWPLTLSPPGFMESWIVCLVDTYCTIKDYTAFAGGREISRFLEEGKS